jgi:hypothetical protein
MWFDEDIQKFGEILIYFLVKLSTILSLPLQQGFPVFTDALFLA